MDSGAVYDDVGGGDAADPNIGMELVLSQLGIDGLGGSIYRYIYCFVSIKIKLTEYKM